jgi:predicted enzyme related to lactoylglutathione lyase
MADARIDYIELPGADIPASKRFYAAIFGWSFTDYGPDYVAFDAQKIGGGLNAARKVAKKSGPLVIFYTDDLAGMEAKVRAAGGDIVGREEFTGGRRFHFLDPNGNELAVWTDK